MSCVALVVVPVMVLYATQDRFIYLPTQEVPPIQQVLPGGSEVRYTTADGVELTGWLVVGEGSPTEPGPAAVLFHGNQGNRAAMAELARVLNDEGYTVLLAEYRGFGGMAGQPSEAGLLRDARAAVDVVERRAGVDPDQVVYIGHSLGTAVATALASERPPRSLVLLAPFTSLPEVAWSRLPLLPYRALMPDEYDSLARIDDVGAPLLIVGGTDDEIVPAHHSEELYNAAEEPRHLVMIPGAHHDLVGPDGPSVAEVVIDFLAPT
jgi:fermentation-respiration switch protein FrsA (DUF1100 family)